MNLWASLFAIYNNYSLSKHTRKDFRFRGNDMGPHLDPLHEGEENKIRLLLSIESCFTFNCKLCYNVCHSLLVYRGGVYVD